MDLLSYARELEAQTDLMVRTPHVTVNINTLSDIIEYVIQNEGNNECEYEHE